MFTFPFGHLLFEYGKMPSGQCSISSLVIIFWLELGLFEKHTELDKNLFLGIVFLTFLELLSCIACAIDVESFPRNP